MRAEPAATKAGCPIFTDYREMCARTQPDFALALARHCGAPRFLIDQRIPFAMEKPCAINATEAAAIARVFAAVPYVIRYSPLIETIREVAVGTNVHFYPAFVRDTLQRSRDGRKPIANLSGNAAAVALVQAAYALSPLTPQKSE